MNEDGTWEYIVVLKITIDEESDPAVWKWGDLIDLSPTERIEVLSSTLQEA